MRKETSRAELGFLHLNTELTHSRNIIVNCVDGGIVVDVVAGGWWLTKGEILVSIKTARTRQQTDCQVISYLDCLLLRKSETGAILKR